MVAGGENGGGRSLRRPRGSKNKFPLPAINDERLKTIILKKANRTISINDPNGKITIPMAQAVVCSLAVGAAKGNQRAQRLFTQLLCATERDNKRQYNEWLEAAITYKVEWEPRAVRLQPLRLVRAARSLRAHRCPVRR